MRLVIAGGGTGGHLFPALAIARAVQKEDPQGSILFVGTRHGIEARIVPKTEFPIQFISARGVRRAGLVNTLGALMELPRGLVQSVALLRRFRPDLVLGVGGYASGPTVAVAVLMRISTAIQEQNSVMGTTNRILARFVDRIFTSWERTEPAPPPEKTIWAGNAIRADLLESLPPPASRDKFHVLIFGGSQGARSINTAITSNLDELRPMADRIAVMHQTGRESLDEVRARYDKAGIEAEVREFIVEMGSAYHWADLVVCRAGAGSLAEITAVGKPAVVVPYPYAIGDHQAKNAAVLESRGAVKVIKEEKLKNGSLVREIRRLSKDPELLTHMAEQSRKAGRPNAAGTISLSLLEMIRGSR